MNPTLARTLPLEDLPARCADASWSITQKADGVRCLVLVGRHDLQAFNRRGEAMALPRFVEASLQGLTGDVWLDGELVKGTLWLFDMPQAGPPERQLVSLTTPYILRRELLEGMYENWSPPDNIRLLPRATGTTEDRIVFVQTMLANNAEGVMLNNIHGPYEPSRNGSRSRQLLKCKFIKQIDCEITDAGRHDKDNFVLSIYRDGEPIEVGEVSALTGDGPRAQLHDVVTVTFLYTSDDNRLYQPVTPKLRNDKLPEECTWDQLEGTYTTKEIIAV